MTFPPTCFPQGQFAFPRSYVPGLVVRCDPPGAVLAGNVLQFWVAGPPDALCVVTFEPNFIMWSSNRWTLDHLVQSATYSYPPALPSFTLPFYVRWVVRPGETRARIEIDAQYGANWLPVDLPSQPGGYWLPPPL